jgi:hypothetical protein
VSVRVWPSPRSAGEERADCRALRALWDVATAQEWTALGVLLCGTTPVMLGPRDALAAGGPVEYGVRVAIKSAVGGDATDFQRNLIARGMGLPR